MIPDCQILVGLLEIPEGRIIVRGKLVARGKGKKVDYLLYASGKQPIAVVEAKDNKHEVAGGMQQALG